MYRYPYVIDSVLFISNSVFAVFEDNKRAKSELLNYINYYDGGLNGNS